MQAAWSIFTAAFYFTLKVLQCERNNVDGLMEIAEAGVFKKVHGPWCVEDVQARPR